MIKLRIFITAFLALVVSMVATAQDNTADTGLMRSNGKIFVVMAVVVTILVGLFTYLVTIDKKITRLEKEGSNQ
ncbi:MAG TPA: CcmD family protein [Sediminibacterium sp.]|jgi:K+-transporting ATPase A subunit|nr:CcmD family protein [Sediminibacterium sp.]HPH36424.1 CcmD family protein [Sediminibacterium sp.]